VKYLRRVWEPKLLGLAVNALAMSSYPPQGYLFRHDMLKVWLNQVDGLWNSGFTPRIIGEFDSQGFPGYTNASRHGSRIYPEAVVNYVRMNSMSLADLIGAIRCGEFFVTTGEILMPECTLQPGQKPHVRVALQWTYPLREIRIVTNQGTRLHPPPLGGMGKTTITVPLDAAKDKWVRVEVRDVANNYCFGQPMKTTKVR